MTKHYCDKCEKEIADEKVWKVIRSKFAQKYAQGAKTNKVLCPPCIDDIF